MKTVLSWMIPTAILAMVFSLGGLAGRPTTASASDPIIDKASLKASPTAGQPDRGVQQLIKDLKDPSDAQRVRAAQELAKLGDQAQPAARALCALALDGPDATRNAALDALQKVRPDLYRQMRALALSIDAGPAVPAPIEFTRVDSRWVADGPNKTASVSAFVNNVGEKTIVYLQLTITYFDASGKIVDQETVEVVNSALVHASDKVRLEPRQSRFLSFRAKHCPAEWHEGKVAIDVKSIDFAG
jgi:hypothetical protein